MKPAGNYSPQKRPYNLSLSEVNAEQARQLTGNLSATVDGLLADFVTRETIARKEKQQLYDKVCEAWNKFEDRYGSFADEHSTL